MSSVSDRDEPPGAEPRRRSGGFSVLQFVLGASLVVAGYAATRLPNVLVERGVLSVFETARSRGTLMHLRAGCEASRAALDDYQADVGLRSVVVPVSASSRAADFDREVCNLALTGLRERGVWWLRLVDEEVACASLAAGEAEFVRARYVVVFPQFSVGDQVIAVFDEEGLVEAGVMRVGSGLESHYRADAR
jgi:hypothetical protein